MVANTHRVEVEVGADGHASAPPSRAAAVAPPPGATASITLLARTHESNSTNRTTLGMSSPHKVPTSCMSRAHAAVVLRNFDCRSPWQSGRLYVHGRPELKRLLSPRHGYEAPSPNPARRQRCRLSHHRTHRWRCFTSINTMMELLTFLAPRVLCIYATTKHRAHLCSAFTSMRSFSPRGVFHLISTFPS
jgi:hypothetical protein